MRGRSSRNLVIRYGGTLGAMLLRSVVRAGGWGGRSPSLRASSTSRFIASASACLPCYDSVLARLAIDFGTSMMRCWLGRVRSGRMTPV